MKIMALYRIAAFALALGAASAAQADTSTVCQSAQIKAAAKMCQQVLNCESAFLKKPSADPDGWGLESCESKALQGFNLAYGKAIAKAHAATPPLVCAQEQESIAISGRLRGNLKNLRDYLRTGWVNAGTDNVSNTLYSGVLKESGAYCNKLLGAEASDALLHDNNDLAIAKNKAATTLDSKLTALISAAADKNLVYGGDPTKVLAATDALALNTALLFGGGITPGNLAAGALSTCALLDGGSVKCWGFNTKGQLGQGNITWLGDGPGEMGDALLPVDLGADASGTVMARQIAVSTGGSHACALLNHGQIKCWGWNNYGQLGLGDNSTSDFTKNRGDASGEMGNNLLTVNPGTDRTARQIVAGLYHTCALLDDGSVKCWGHNAKGQLGQDNTTDVGDGLGQAVKYIPPISLGLGRSARQISAGDEHSCALLDDGGVKCWGDNSYGQLGQGDASNRGIASGDMAALQSIDLGNQSGGLVKHTALQIAAGSTHTCALLDDGSVKCWGYNVDGELGQGGTATLGDGAGEMGDSLAAIDFGANRTARQIAAGGEHSCALLDDGSVKCWGRNNAGQLGLGDTNNRGDGVGLMGDKLPTADLGAGRTARQISTGYGHTCARLDDGGIKCWGHNLAGGLGQGDTANRGKAAQEMGFYLPKVDLGNP